MRPHPGRRNPRAGVMLLELLLSMVLMAAMTLALAAVLGLIGQATLRLGVAGTTTDLLLARHTLRGWIEAAPLTAIFEGSPERLSFEMLTDEPPFSAAEPTTVTLLRNEAGAVVVETTAFGDGGATRSLTLLPNGELRILYFGSLDRSVPQAWHGDWPPTSGPPDLVRIEYGGPDDALPPLTVIPAFVAAQTEISLSSPSPPG